MADNTLSFAAAIINPSKRQQACFQGTIEQYQSAVNWLVPIANQHWKQIQQAEHANEKQGALERLVHATKNNPTPPHAEFDQLYPNFPSYLRRAACTTAIGAVSSWRSNHENWVKEGRKGQEPKLSTHYHPTPTFYKTNMWQTTKIGSQVDETELMRDPQPSPEEQAAKHEARELAVQAQEKASSEGTGSQRRDRYAKYRKARQAKKDKQGKAPLWQWC